MAIASIPLAAQTRTLKGSPHSHRLRLAGSVPAVIYGGAGMNPQLDAMRRGIDILVATPGRLLDHHGQRTLDLSHVEIFVLDEADRMLDMGFINDIRKIVKFRT